MSDLLLVLNQPVVLWSLLLGSLALILIDYLFPIDWLAYVGYVLFAVFVGATAPLSPFLSVVTMGGVAVLMLILHELIFAKYLTNAPRYEHPIGAAVPGLAKPQVAEKAADEQRDDASSEQEEA